MTIAQLQDRKWYVVQSRTCNGITVWYPISQGYSTSYEARAQQVNIVFRHTKG